MRVSIAGAGLGGLCLAQGLRQAGIEADVHERDPAITARFQGYRLVLNPTGLAALRGCLPPRWHPLLDAITGDAYGERLVLDPRLNKIGELGPGRTGTVIDRHVLRHLLLTGLTVRTGAALTGYDVLDDGRVEARFADGDPVVADLLVGADGVGSAVRAVLSPQTTPTDTGVRFVIGRTPLTGQFAGLARAFGSKIAGNGVSLLLGAMRFRTPPKEAAETLAPEVVLPDVGDYVRWAMILPPDGPAGGLTPQETVLARTEGWHPDLRALIEQADPDNSTLLSIRVVEPRERWAPGPVTLLGDAIHATSPTGGNGANTALRDADLLRRCLTEGRPDLPGAVDAYERQMLQYGAEAVRHSLDALPAFVPQPESA
ncbi:MULTISPECIES: NAD(P)/FAD-dependent oxidoreductase [unclassified Amycolatopsis]|uniref:FAD-dependent oxidoreductase n=1 Tax=unclassified Amycolatopsis TaxID=2618356 RepID=UPI002875A239|nr:MULTISPECIES: NAD(P)/FAD-dependent oxidoreductase [unclassified Amycolatopsis]MDS0140134.1 FAD-dependent monooxygenase [Amycolatopsis sp. 505]MDS0148688.1 FAD-dependent monooxygenase [Amycolatopsis sp. CM201R]